MGTRLFFTLLLLCLTLTIFAQPDTKANRNNERVRTARIVYVTDKMQLTSEEAARFWPVVREMEKELKPLQQRRRKTRNLELSEEAARKRLFEEFENEEKMLQIRKSYTKSFLDIIPASKLLRFEAANHAFKRELINRIRRDRSDRRRSRFR